MKKNVLVVFTFFVLNTTLLGQILNCYAKVNSIASTTLNVSNVNESFDTFEDGEEVVIMQMQDDVIGANTLDDVNFGNLSGIASVGLYEVRRIISHTEALGLPVTITLNAALTNTYSTGANSSLQMISFRNMGTPTNYASTSNITALSWDGNIGAVIALNIPGVFTLAHNMNADAAGFRGGLRSNNFYIGGTACFNTPFRANNNQHAFKGEGIYKNTTATFNNARAKLLNGGGGGVQINAGGGGGGNFTGGGLGGYGWNSTAAGCTFANGGFGYGGIDLSASISATRIFMGGGGGGGQQNDGVGSSGANGGGIILIKANQLLTTGACGPLRISANGATAANSSNDGAGGGGAGGSIILNINSFSIAATCPLTVNASGGNGGTTNSSTHAGGGAGGQGFVLYSIPQPTTNVTTTTLNGNPGCNNNSAPCTNVAGSATGVNNSGIFANILTPLPITLLSFSVTTCRGEAVCINWETASEVNNDFFTLERSKDAIQFQSIARLKGNGNSNEQLSYSFVDDLPYTGVSYYRLKQTDYNGVYTYSNIETIERSGEGDFEFKPYPNSNTGEKINFEIKANKNETIQLKIIDALTKVCYENVVRLPLQGKNNFFIEPERTLPKGVYTIFLKTERKVYSSKLIIE